MLFALSVARKRANSLSEDLALGKKKNFFFFTTHYSRLPENVVSLSISPGFGRLGNWATVRLGRAPDQFILDSWDCGVGGRDRAKWREIEIWVKEIEGDLRGLHRLPRLSSWKRGRGVASRL